MIAEAKATARNAGLLVAQQGANVVCAFLVAALTPRLMGPDVYGRYTLITSLAVWFVLSSGLGLLQVVSRYVPQLAMQGQTRKFLEHLLTVRLLSGTVAALLYLMVSLIWLRDLDALTLVIVSAITFVQIVTNFVFVLFLGFNQAARWGMGQVVRGWVSLILVLTGFYLGGLRGACLGLLIAELIVLCVGMRWARPYLVWPRLYLDWRYLAPYLRFGLVFYASDLLISAFQRGGPMLMRFISSDYTQIGYFGLAHNVYLMVAVLLTQLSLAFAPLFAQWRDGGQHAVLREWTARLLKWLTFCGMFVVFAVLLLGTDLTPLVLGAAYRPVAVNLLPLSLALLMAALSSVARLLALVYDRPGVALEAAGIQLVAFVVLGLPLMAWQGSLGGCLAVLTATTLSGLYFTWRMECVARYSLRGWMLAIALGGLFAPLAWLRSTWVVNAILYGVFLVGYGGLLFGLRVVTPGEITAVWRAFGSSRLFNLDMVEST